MKLRNALLIAGAIVTAAAIAPAIADITYTQGSGTTIFDFTCFTTKHCSAHTPINSAGTEIFTSSAPGQVTGANGTFPATQSGTWTVQPGNTANTTPWLFQVRDAAGNARGANVDASNRLTTAPTMISGSVASGAVASGAYASGSIASGAYASGSIASGAMVDLGAQADSACGTDTGTCSLIALLKRNNSQQTTLGASPLPAQTGIGNVNIGAVQSAGSNYETVAASQTAQAMGATGATGDYLSHCVIYPASTSPGAVTVFDNTNAAGTNVIAFAGGASSTSNLTPISVPVGAISTAGAWKVTTGANVSVTCYGKFT